MATTSYDAPWTEEQGRPPLSDTAAWSDLLRPNASSRVGLSYNPSGSLPQFGVYETPGTAMPEGALSAPTTGNRMSSVPLLGYDRQFGRLAGPTPFGGKAKMNMMQRMFEANQLRKQREHELAMQLAGQASQRELANIEVGGKRDVAKIETAGKQAVATGEKESAERLQSMVSETAKAVAGIQAGAQAASSQKDYEARIETAKMNARAAEEEASATFWKSIASGNQGAREAAISAMGDILKNQDTIEARQYSSAMDDYVMQLTAYMETPPDKRTGAAPVKPELELSTPEDVEARLIGVGAKANNELAKTELTKLRDAVAALRNKQNRNAVEEDELRQLERRFAMAKKAFSSGQ